MTHARSSGLLTVLGFGIVALLVACLSILDMFLPKPYDGVVLEPERDDLTVRSIVPDSGAALAGIRPGDRIAGLGQEIVRTPAEAARALQRHRIGDTINYLIDRDGKLLEVRVQLGPRRLGTPLYLYACFSGFLFFFIGLFVLLSRPDAPRGSPTHVFFVLCTLFLLFLVCRLRPASYSWVDRVVLTTGTLSLLALPAAFLHFFLVFPGRFRLTLTSPEETWQEERPVMRGIERFVNTSPYLFTSLYLLPPLLYAATLAAGHVLGARIRLVSGAPLASWVLMGDYLVLGLLALLASMLRAKDGRERRQTATVFVGTLLGITPFLVLGIAFPSLFRTDRYLLVGVVPLILVPLTFAYAIVRFQFFDIRVIVRRSVLYTLTTAVVSGTYAVSIAAFNLVFRDASLGRSPFFPLLLALAIVALFDPLRRRLQEPVDRFFFREVYDARRAVEEISGEMVREFSFERLDALLTTRLAEVMHLAWAKLYRREGRVFVSAGERPQLPRQLPASLLVFGELARQDRPTRLGILEPLKTLEHESRAALESFSRVGTRLLVPMRGRDELHAVLAIGPKLSDEEFGRDDLQLIRTVANQGTVALENARLYRERARQVELEKELEIARQVQFSLIPATMPAPRGWEIAAHCAPARQVGGDFYDMLPSLGDGATAVVVGDVSGKSVPGAMLMVAAREVLHTAALGGATPEQIMEMANRRLYSPQPRLFVALAFLTLGRAGTLEYALAGQPAPLLRRLGGAGVEEGPAPAHRLPLGALREGAWDFRAVTLAPGDLALFYSDGLTEAQDGTGEFFGEERVGEEMRTADDGPQRLVERLVRRVESFVGNAEPYDDVTVVAVRWTGEA
jgi:serine phosphatase RsbU (regulator of sigma subunit)